MTRTTRVIKKKLITRAKYEEKWWERESGIVLGK